MASKSKTDTPVDIVAVPSLRADGTPDQTAGFVTLDEDGAKAQKEEKASADKVSAELQDQVDQV
ncbi:hypothetical protein [Pseudactinotalea suaedae]|uniref:hypothetical protein n=1 Tax=Pseudactinotalea suaedae TaxID=1524924 RepID=UPI0012E12B26|nr:hypothetical protein [Pseudactinotalea suaedae]